MQIQEGENGILVEPNDVQSLKLAIEPLINNPKMVEQLSRMAPRDVKCIDKHIGELMEFYNSNVIL
jgi:glycosyltransferase involved in cell wall biosynthesis